MIIEVLPAAALQNQLIIQTEHFAMLLPGEWKVRSLSNDEVNVANKDESVELDIYEIGLGNVDLGAQLALTLIDTTMSQNESLRNYLSVSRDYLGVPIITYQANDSIGNKMVGCEIYSNGYVAILYYSEGPNTPAERTETLLDYVSSLQFGNDHVFVLDDVINDEHEPIGTDKDDEKNTEQYSLDIQALSDADLSSEIERLTSEKIKRLKMQVPATGRTEDGAIVFRGVPWYSTRKETERLLGMSSSTKGPNDIYRMDAIDYDGITMGNERVDDLGGCMAYYSELTIAGLKPSSSYICYLYPIVDGIIIRDDSLAEIYFGYYKFRQDDFGDFNAIYEELYRKLTDTYGKAAEMNDKYHYKAKWSDQYGNYIQLMMTDDKDYVALGYMAGDADQKLDEMIAAIQNEKAAEELLKHKENVDNYDGL